MKKITVVPRGSNNSQKKKLALYIFNKPMQEARTRTIIKNIKKITKNH
jgi:hypothetical protein